MTSGPQRTRHLPRGLWGKIVDNILWITLILGGAAAAILAVYTEQIFGG